MEEVVEQIEQQRALLYAIAKEHSFTSPEMLAVSRELDELLNIYERLKCLTANK